MKIKKTDGQTTETFYKELANSGKLDSVLNTSPCVAPYRVIKALITDIFDFINSGRFYYLSKSEAFSETVVSGFGLLNEEGEEEGEKKYKLECQFDPHFQSEDEDELKLTYAVQDDVTGEGYIGICEVVIGVDGKVEFIY